MKKAVLLLSIIFFVGVRSLSADCKQECEEYFKKECPPTYWTNSAAPQKRFTSASAAGKENRGGRVEKIDCLSEFQILCKSIACPAPVLPDAAKNCPKNCSYLASSGTCIGACSSGKFLEHFDPTKNRIRMTLPHYKDVYNKLTPA